MWLRKLKQEQSDYENMFKLEVSSENIKNNKEAKKVFKFINRRKNCINFLDFLHRKDII